MKYFKNTVKILLLFFIPFGVIAQSSVKGLRTIYINSNTTTHVISPEPIQYVDISINNIAGNIIVDNILQLKPLDTISKEYFAVNPQLSIVGETFIAQYELVYSNNPLCQFLV